MVQMARGFTLHILWSFHTGISNSNPCSWMVVYLQFTVRLTWKRLGYSFGPLFKYF